MTEMHFHIPILLGIDFEVSQHTLQQSLKSGHLAPVKLAGGQQVAKLKIAYFIKILVKIMYILRCYTI